MLRRGPSPYPSVGVCLSLHSRTSRTILSASPAAGDKASVSQSGEPLHPGSDRQIDLEDEEEIDLTLP